MAGQVEGARIPGPRPHFSPAAMMQPVEAVEQRRADAVDAACASPRKPTLRQPPGLAGRETQFSAGSRARTSAATEWNRQPAYSLLRRRTHHRKYLAVPMERRIEDRLARGWWHFVQCSWPHLKPGVCRSGCKTLFRDEANGRNRCKTVRRPASAGPGQQVWPGVIPAWGRPLKHPSAGCPSLAERPGAPAWMPAEAVSRPRRASPPR